MFPATCCPRCSREQIEWKNGWLLPPDRPGLGVTFDREAARAHPMREVPRMALHRADGSLTNM